MENKTITTPSGYTVTLKTDFTYGEYEDLQAQIGAGIKLNPTTGAPENVDFKALQDVNHKALAILLIKIEKDGGVVDIAIRDLPAKDGKSIMQEVDKVLKDAQPDEKKGI